MKLIDASTEIRLAVFGEWLPPQLADLLVQQRVEEPESPADVVLFTTGGPAHQPLCGSFDVALSTTFLHWSDWVCEPLWNDTLAVAVARRSHLLTYQEVPLEEVLKQPVLYVHPAAHEPWCMAMQQQLRGSLQTREQIVSSFDLAMTLVSAGYGIAIAPAARLAGYRPQGVVARRLANTRIMVATYLLRPSTCISGALARFVRRTHLVC